VDASTLIDTKIKSLADWRGKTLAAIRRIVHEAVPDVTEEWKWMGTPGAPTAYSAWPTPTRKWSR
jgi:hypothetical protein